MKLNLKIYLAVISLSLIALPVTTTRLSCRENKIRVETKASFWWLLEEVENGLFQNGSLDPAAEHASGFNFNSGRIALSWRSEDEKVELITQLRLEERADLIDFYGTWNFRPWLKASVGQMRIPSTYEGMTPFNNLDFISRSSFARHISDYSLSRTPYISSMMAVKSYDRDLGLALKGNLKSNNRKSISWFLMVSNGIGAGNYIGGKEDNGLVYTNDPGDYYYGCRIEVSPAEGLTFGFHLSRNIHRNIAVGNRGPVLDLERSARTADLRTVLPLGQRLYAFYGEGDMDDFSLAQRYLFEYSGWGLSLIHPIQNLKLELCGRFDRFETRYTTGSITTTQENITMGVNFDPDERIRLQLNYTIKNTKNISEPDLNDDILYLNFQFTFDSFLQE
ncbi:MAG TPA: hypothetical protein VKO43_01345 [Candidatus Krumholzibacteriaceae bacterium]|nr:hypothetical protein [Candidatus Krumholzibacteriaceae bacterium]